MLRILLTGDNHIGLKYAGHPQAAALAQARLSAVKTLVDTANQEDCALLAVAGDLFENIYGVLRRDVAAVLDMLSAFRGTVAVLPGNHDYYDKDAKLWQYFEVELGARDNVLLLSQYRPYCLNIDGQEVVLYPAGCTSLHSAPGENNLGWIKALPALPQGASHIGSAHGAVEGETIDSEGKYFLMTREELEALPMDLWLLGHTHVPFPRGLKKEVFTEAGRIFNAGVHVQKDVACGAEGCCFIIEIDENKKPRAKKAAPGELRFYRKELAVSAGELEARLARELEGMGNGSVVELVLSGAVTAEEYDRREELLDQVLARFLEGSYHDHDLSRLISRELIRAEFPETSFAAGLLEELLPQPKEAQLAYELLKSLKRGG